MKPAKTKETGCICDFHSSVILRMWDVEVPSGPRPLQHHQHLQFEIMLVTSGSGVYTTEKKKYPINPGDMFIFSGNEPHCITDVGEHGLCITNLHFAPGFLCEHAPEFHSGIDIKFYFHHSNGFENCIEKNKNEPLRLIFEKIREELLNDLEEAPLMIRSLLSFLVIGLIRDHNYFDHNRKPKPDRMLSINKALDYINIHFSEDITLRDIAACAGLSPAYFSTVFKSTIGIPLWEYINSRRIEKAIRLIVSSENSGNMFYVAQECGFNNTANFNKAFRKYAGMTPREYRAGGFSNIS